MFTVILAYIGAKYKMDFQALYLGTVMIDLALISGIFKIDL